MVDFLAFWKVIDIVQLIGGAVVSSSRSSQSILCSCHTEMLITLKRKLFFESYRTPIYRVGVCRNITPKPSCCLLHLCNTGIKSVRRRDRMLYTKIIEQGIFSMANPYSSEPKIRSRKPFRFHGFFSYLAS